MRRTAGRGTLRAVDTDTARREQAASFGAAADAYERGRPPYPDEAVDWLLPPGARRVLDLGAGTGKLTRSLRARGLDVVAVDPSPGMLARLSAALPDVEVRRGGAERLPLPDADVDAVLVAQAWHWVDPARAVPEVARVLRPGGALGLVWNVRDEGSDWVARLGEALHRGDEQDPATAAPVVGPPFGPVERHDVRWVHTTTPQGLLDLVASRSYVITLPDAERARVLERVADLLRTHPDLRGRREVPLPYLTRCSRTRRP